MSTDSRLSHRWRVVAVALSVAWLVSVASFVGFAVGGTTHRLVGAALIFVMLAGLVVLALLKNLGKVIGGEVDEPGVWEFRLAGATVLMLVGGWTLYLFS